MTSPDLPLKKLTIYLTKLGVTDQEKILKEPYEYVSLPLRAAGRFLGVLHVKESELRPPHWLDFLRPGLDAEIEELALVNASSSAVLLVQRETQVFAIAFGYGRYMLNAEAFDHRFGLRCTLNAIDPERIRSLDRKTFERVQRHTREQVSQDSSLAAFEVDIEQDLLRSVTGTPADESLAHRFSGRDALSAAVRTTVDGLPDLLDRYHHLQSDNAYKDNFAWVDRIAEVIDQGLKERLNEALVASINAGEIDRIWLAAPEILDWSSIEGFQYRSAQSAEVYPNLNLRDYLTETGRRGSLETKHLSSDRISCVTPDGEPSGLSWNLRATLCGEFEYRGVLYTLDEGVWYKIDEDFAEQVEQAIEAIPPGSIELPAYNHRNEAHYNEKVASESGGVLHLMDRRLVPTGMSHGSIEFCDLLASDKVLIHVKRYGGSSALSHLFNQGFVSAQLMLRDRTFRTSANDVLPPACKFDDPSAAITPSEYEIEYAIVAPSDRPLKLPFFSMVSLRNIERSLREMGFRVSLAEIENAA